MTLLTYINVKRMHQQKQACSQSLASVLAHCMTNHNIATSAKHPLSRSAGGRDTEVFFGQLADLWRVDLT